MKAMLTKDVQFSQKSVAYSFDNGQSLQSVVQGLQMQQLKAEDFPAIRVVEYQGQWYSLDNRRLRVFKDAFVENIFVEVVSLKNENIKREFFAKKTNQSMDGGGRVRPSTSGISREHFDGGKYAFTKEVLGWNVEKIKSKLPNIACQAPLPARFSDRGSYFRSFLNLILEEARASLFSEYEKNIHAGVSSFVLTLSRSKFPRSSENPACLYLDKGRLDWVPKSGDVILLQSAEKNDLQYLGMATYKQDAIDTRVIEVKVIVDEYVKYSTPNAFAEGARWHAWPLGSLITHMRMYDVCMASPQASFEWQLFSGNLSVGVSNYSPQIIDSFSLESSELNQLNPSQQEAVQKFLNVKTGIQLVEGPPGTGKTKKVVCLLDCLLKQGDRVLVCAPSNKAVQVIAESFIEKYPEKPVIFVGVEEKLCDAPALEEVFIHTWGQNTHQLISKIIDLLWELIPEKLTQEKQSTFLGNFKKVIELFYKLSQGVILYKISCLQGVINLIQNELNVFIQEVQEAITKNFVFGLEYKQSLSKISSSFQSLQAKISLLMSDDSESGLELQLLNGAQIIFSTLSVAGRESMKKMSRVNTLVVDEASQTTEAETLIALFSRPERLLLVGDTNQLPATIFSTDAEKLNFGRSLMWRLIKDCQQSYSLLKTQYRMHSAIRSWPSLSFYNNEIEDSVAIMQGARHLNELSAFKFLHPRSFINVRGAEKKEHHSFMNQSEINMIVELLSFFKKRNIDIEKQVGIVTFYKGQEAALNRTLKGQYPEIKVKTVDGFQGGESDFIIISFVRSNTHGGVGFLNDFRRLNVALTRAKYSLIMLGHVETLISRDERLKSLLNNVIENNHLFEEEWVRNEILACQESKKTNIKIEPQKKSVNIPEERRKNHKKGKEKANLDYHDNNMRHPAFFKEESSAKASTSKRDHSLKGSCWFFNGAVNSCRYGASCKFEHVLK